MISIILLAFSQLRIWRLPSVLIRFLWKMCNVLKRIKKSIFRFSFFKLSWKFIDNWGDLSKKITIPRKINIWNLIFLSIQPIPDLSCKFDHFWKKKIDFDVCMHTHEKTIAKYAVDANLFRLGSINPKKISSPWMLFGLP